MRERYPLEMLLLLALGACSFDPPGIAPQDAQGDSRAGQDVTPGDGSALDRHALITEVNALGAFGFIEIYNPTTTAIDLSAYYLSDCNEYWKLPGQQAGNASIILQLSDFLVKFPPGQMLTAGGVATIAIDGPAFENEYTSLPTYTIGVPIAGSTAMIPTVIPAGTPDPQITDSGEMVVLVHWDGTSDRVEDVDLIVTGQPSTDNAPIAKAPVDGPDLDLTTSSYALDGLSMPAMADVATGKKTYKRIRLEGTDEQHAGTGNGITGDDETTEQTSLTWDSGLSNGTPGVIATTLQ